MNLRARDPWQKQNQGCRNFYFRRGLLPTNNVLSFDIADDTDTTRAPPSRQKSSQAIKDLLKYVICAILSFTRVTGDVRVGKLIRGFQSYVLRTSNTFTNVEMQFAKVLLAAAAFVVANAQVEFTMGPSFFAATYTAGVTAMNLTWDMASGPVTLKLKSGPKTALNTVSTIASKGIHPYLLGNLLMSC